MIEPRFEKRLGWPDTPKRLQQKECFTYISEKGVEINYHDFNDRTGKCLRCPLTISKKILAQVIKKKLAREAIKNARSN